MLVFTGRVRDLLWALLWPAAAAPRTRKVRARLWLW